MGTFVSMRLCECGHPRSEHERVSATAALLANQTTEETIKPRDSIGPRDVPLADLPANEGGNTIYEHSTSGLVDDEHAIPPKHKEESARSEEHSAERIGLMAERQAVDSRSDPALDVRAGVVVDENDAEVKRLARQKEDEAQANLNAGEDPAPCQICEDCNDWRPSQETVAPADDQTNVRFQPNMSTEDEQQKTDVQLQNEANQSESGSTQGPDEEAGDAAIADSATTEEANEQIAANSDQEPAPTATDEPTDSTVGADRDAVEPPQE